MFKIFKINYSGHEFKKGEVVEIKECCASELDGRLFYKAISMETADFWWVYENEIEALNAKQD